MKSLRLLMKHTSQGVRDETKQLILEMYRWTGPEFKHMLEAELPSAQVHLDFDSFAWEVLLRLDGMTTCDFTSFLTVVWSYLNDDGAIMKDCLQFNLP